MTSDATVLVADDDADVLALITEVVGELGCRVLGAANGEEALALFGDEAHVAVVLADVRMPRLDGLAFTSAVKKQSPRTEILIITGCTELETAIQALRLGAFDYLVKPIAIDAIRQAVKHAIARHRLATENERLLRDLAATNQALEELQAQLIEQERLAAAREVIAGLSHLVLNPLTGILGALEVLKGDGLPPAARATVCEDARREAARIEGVIRALSEMKRVASTSYVGDVRMLDLDRSRRSPRPDGAANAARMPRAGGPSCVSSASANAEAEA